MNEIKEVKLIIYGISGIGFLFFTINQFLNQMILKELLELVEYDTTIFMVNYYLMMLIGAGLVLLAFREFLKKE